MGLKWKDVDFIGGRIEIMRSVVDQAIGKCKTEASQKPVVIDEHIAHGLIAWRQESIYTGPDDWVWASPHKKGKQPLWLSTIMRYYIQARGKARWHSEENRLAHLSPHILKLGRVPGRGRESGAGTGTPCLVQYDDE